MARKTTQSTSHKVLEDTCEKYKVIFISEENDNRMDLEKAEENDEVEKPLKEDSYFYTSKIPTKMS